MSPLSALGSPLAILVYQGSDPTPPYPALSDPAERQALLRPCASGIIGVAWLKARTGYVGSASPDGLDFKCKGDIAIHGGCLENIGSYRFLAF